MTIQDQAIDIVSQYLYLSSETPEPGDTIEELLSNLDYPPIRVYWGSYSEPALAYPITQSDIDAAEALEEI